MDGAQILGATIGIQLLGIAFIYGMHSRASNDHERRLGILEVKSTEHGEDIAALKGARSLSTAAGR
jgi:hypothetical protein